VSRLIAAAEAQRTEADGPMSAAVQGIRRQRGPLT
jgi:hypothetical protein